MMGTHFSPEGLTPRIQKNGVREGGFLGKNQGIGDDL
jgi:hypothetical protein